MVFASAGFLTTLGSSFAFGADTGPPSPPGTITVTNVTATGSSLKWGPSSDDLGIEGYRIYRGPAGAADSELSLIATTDAVTSYSAKSLRSGFAYTFGVVAIDAANNKSAMRTTTSTTLASSDATAPLAPSSSSVTVRAFSATRIDVVWGPSTSTDVAFYEVRRDGALVGTVERPTSQRFSDNGLAPSTSYGYTVTAVDSAGNRSAATSAKSVSTLDTGAAIIARGPYLSNVSGTSAIVSWWTNIATDGSLSINGSTTTDPAGVVQHHAVSVTGLSAGTSYPYAVSSAGESATGTLRTAAKPGETFSFAAIGDFGGQSTGEARNAANIGKSGTSFIQTLGDNIYPSAGLPDPNFSTTYSDFDARFFKQFGPVVKDQALFPANGNKEYYGDGEFWNAFPMPGSNHSWYSYNWGSAHILVLDSEQPYETGSEQYDFAQADLAAHQGDRWRIVAIQRPPYSSTSANSSATGVKQYLVPLFQASHVDLVLSGNSHNYERTHPLVDGTPVASGGIVYVVSGAGGNGFNRFGSFTAPYTAFRESSYYEFAKVTVSSAAILVEAVRSDTNAVVDTTTITSPSAAPSLTPSDDATIDPATGSPNSSRLKMDASSPVNNMLLKFTVPATCTRITAASLRMTVGSGSTDPSTHGGEFYATSSGDPNAAWTEDSVRWDTAPAATGNAVSLDSAVTGDTTYTLDVTTLVPSAGGTFTIRGSSSSANGVGYYSKEGAPDANRQPSLQVTCG